MSDAERFLHVPRSLSLKEAPRRIGREDVIFGDDLGLERVRERLQQRSPARRVRRVGAKLVQQPANAAPALPKK